MRPSVFKKAVAASSVVYAVNALNILITNDDGFGTANIREMYKAIKAYGHQAYIVASSSNQSGMGGTVVYTTEQNLTADTEFGIVKKGAPSVGPDPMDSHIWYYNGTPSAAVQIGLDYVLPRHANFTTPDLILAGPNYGTNLGPFLYTLSGTMGATYTAVERGIPAISFSGGTSVQTPYYWVNETTPAGLKDPATIYGQLAADLAQQLIDNVAAAGGGRLLPNGYGLNVNIPFITSYTNNTCVAPPFVHTRLTGGAVVDIAVFNETTGLFKYADLISDGTNTCINGDCSLPGETQILRGRNKCLSSVSIFTIDYDAPEKDCHSSGSLRGRLEPLVGYVNGTTAGNGTSGGNGTTVPTPTTSPVAVNAAESVRGSVLGVLVALCVGLLAL